MDYKENDKEELFTNCRKPNYPKIDASFERFDTSLYKYLDKHDNFVPMVPMWR